MARFFYLPVSGLNVRAAAAIIEFKVLPQPKFATLLPVNVRGGTEAGFGK